MAVPAYFRDQASWDSLCLHSSLISFVVANENSGPGPGLPLPSDPSLKILGYVRTGTGRYLVDTIRPGSRPLEEILADVELWYDLYPHQLSGIFFDEVPSMWDRTEPDTPRTQYPKFARAVAHVRQAHPGAIVVLNSGSPPVREYADLADAIVLREHCADTIEVDLEIGTEWIAEYEQKSKFWLLGHTAQRGAASVKAIMDAARRWGVGHVYITDKTDWNTLPTKELWEGLMINR